jgi:uncharacterized protein
MLPFLTFVWTWMRLKSDSIWPCVISHASHNTFIQQFFNPLTDYLTVSILMAIYFWSRRDEMESDYRRSAPADYVPASGG